MIERVVRGSSIAFTFSCVVLMVWSTASAATAGPLSETEKRIQSFYSAGTCGGKGYIQQGHIVVQYASTFPDFEVSYASNTTNWRNGSFDLAFTYALHYAVELSASSGSVLELSALGAPTPETVSVSCTGSNVNLSLQWSENVTNASGMWTPANITSPPQGSNPDPIQSRTKTVGTATFDAVFHLQNLTSNSTSFGVKFDLGILHWPWANNSDRLGIALVAGGSTGDHFVYSGPNRTLSDISDFSGLPQASLEFGASASTGSTPIAVTAAAGIYSTAIVALTFTGAVGGYPTLTYDPWVELYYNPAVPPGTNTPPGGGGEPDSWTWVALVIAAAVSALLGYAIFRIRRRSTNPRLAPPVPHGLPTVRSWC